MSRPSIRSLGIIIVVLLAASLVGAPAMAQTPVSPSSSAATPGSLAQPRFQHTATLLGDGRVLVAGGLSANGNARSTAELWDPTAQQFQRTGGMVVPRAAFTATALTDGRVLMVGGVGVDAAGSAELWDPTTGRFTPTGAPSGPRSDHTATLLTDGRVLVVGGLSPNGSARATAEIWDPGDRELHTHGLAVRRTLAPDRDPARGWPGPGRGWPERERQRPGDRGDLGPCHGYLLEHRFARRGSIRSDGHAPA